MNLDDFHYIAKLVLERSAIVLDDNKGYLVEARMSSVCQEQGIDDIAALVVKLRASSGGPLQTLVVEAMTTNETSFFRDIKPFETLKIDLIPELMDRLKAERKIHIWCAACSSGQEPYSIAMALRETFPELEGWDITILATDLSAEMVERASKGSYSQIEVNRGLPAPLLIKYFERNGTSWQIREDLRRSIEFKQMNLIKPWPVIPPADILFIRNVLIYFDIEIKKQILANMRKALRPGGYLLLGGAETTLNIDPSFQRIQDTQSPCYRNKES